MTQPAGDGPAPPQPHHSGPAGSPSPYGELYRPASDSAPGGPGLRERVKASGRASGRPGPGPWWLAAIAAAGIPVGLLWWLLAPGGLNLLTGVPALASGTNTEGWLPRDLVLAGLTLFAGCLTGLFLTGKRTGAPAPATVVLAVLCAAAGAVIAWRVGILAGEWWGAREDASANPSIAFSLRAYAVLAVWPAAVAVSVFLVNLLGLLGKPDGDRA
jgi:hypothetical protein